MATSMTNLFNFGRPLPEPFEKLPNKKVKARCLQVRFSRSHPRASVLKGGERLLRLCQRHGAGRRREYRRPAVCGGVQILHGGGYLPPGGVRRLYGEFPRQRLRPRYGAHGTVHRPPQRTGRAALFFAMNSEIARGPGVQGELPSLSGAAKGRLSGSAKGGNRRGDPLR